MVDFSSNEETLAQKTKPATQKTKLVAENQIDLIFSLDSLWKTGAILKVAVSVLSAIGWAIAEQNTP